MYTILGRIATGVVTIILTDILMEKYDVAAKVKARYAQTRTACSRFAAQVRADAGSNEDDTPQTETQTRVRMKFSVASATAAVQAFADSVSQFIARSKSHV